MSALSGLLDFFRRNKQYAQQNRELAAAREELAQMREQTERMRAGMRRCITCDYRREVIGRQSDDEQQFEGEADPSSR